LCKRLTRLAGDEVPTEGQSANSERSRGAGLGRAAMTIAIIDAPETWHGQLMKRHARVGEFTPLIRWIRPSLHLPQDLASLEGVAAVAIPLGVKGAAPQDRFTSWMMDAIRQVMARNIPVFVAAGNRRPNLLAQAGIAVSISDVPGSTSTSEACVRAAAQAACQFLCYRKTSNPFQNSDMRSF
jgi:hypothetical protein